MFFEKFRKPICVILAIFVAGTAIFSAIQQMLDTFEEMFKIEDDSDPE
jgi:hypothetical protein